MMKTKKTLTQRQSLFKLTRRIFIFLIAGSYLLTSAKSHGLVPDFAEIVELEGQGISVNSRSARLGYRLSRYTDRLTIPAPYANEQIFADISLIKNGIGDLLLRARAQNGATTNYYIPCTVVGEHKSQVQITWSNGKQTSCGEGMHLSSNTHRANNPLNGQISEITQRKYSDKHPIFLNAQRQNRSLHYYCSSVPNQGTHFGHIAVGLTSMEETCQQSQEICYVESQSGCSIATMGEWRINDRNLTMSMTCANDQIASKKITGAEISHAGPSSMTSLIEQLILSRNNVLPRRTATGLQSCYLEVYSPKEILASPIGNQETIIDANWSENGKIEVQVLKGQVKLRSTDNPQGIVANQGNQYVFNLRGSISVSRGGSRDVDESCETEIAQYQEQLRALIDRDWQSPTPPRKGTWNLTLVYELSQEGSVEGIRMVRSSGYRPIDNSAVERVRTLDLQGYFPPLPSCYQQETLEIEHNFVVNYS